MLWEDFREAYATTQLSTVRDRSVDCVESRLDIAERILKPRRLCDVASSDALHRLQADLPSGCIKTVGQVCNLSVFTASNALQSFVGRNHV